MPRSMWTGSISFGLVNVPVKLYPAVRSRSISFVQLHAPDGGRIRYRKICEAEDKEVPNDEIVKAHEIAPGRYVIVTPEELEAADPEASRSIEIEDFVDLSDIDPIYYDKPYYLGPYNEAAERPYRLLARAMQEAGKVAIGRFVMRNKEYLAAIRPLGDVLVISTMNWADEVLAREDVGPSKEVEVRDKELEMARQLIASLESGFEPERYEDTYRERLVGLIERKAEGEEIVAPEVPAEPEGAVVDLMSALEQSLSDARKRRQGQREEKKAGGGKKKRSGSGSSSGGRSGGKKRQSG